MYYNPKLIVADHKLKQFYDITQLVESITWTSSLTDWSGSCQFVTKASPKDLKIEEGWSVQLVVNDKIKVFRGMVTEREISCEGFSDVWTTTFTAHDQFFLFRTKLSMNIKRSTFPQIFKSCMNALIKGDVINKYVVTKDAQKYKGPPLTFKNIENEEISRIIKNAVEEQYVKTGKENWFYYYDNFGTVTLDYIAKPIKGVPLTKDGRYNNCPIIGDGSGLESFEYKSRITEHTANKIVLSAEKTKIQEGSHNGPADEEPPTDYLPINKKKKKKSKAKKPKGKITSEPVENKASIAKYGILVWKDKMNNQDNNADNVQEIAKRMAQAKAWPEVDITLKCIGELLGRHYRIFRAGEVFVVKIQALANRGFLKPEGNLFCAKMIKHTWKFNDYRMEIDAVDMQSDKYNWWRTI